MMARCFFGVRDQPCRQPDLYEDALSTGSRKLIEGNLGDDAFWGVCNGQGDNMLGVLPLAKYEKDRVRAASFDASVGFTPQSVCRLNCTPQNQWSIPMHVFNIRT